MNKVELLKKITRAAKRDARNRRDPRYLATMGFLIAKGFLKTNQAIPLQPNRKLVVGDAVWAGVNVEPRILEVLPAAILRLPRHFHLDPKEYPELWLTLNALRNESIAGESIWGIPFEKFKPWLELPLRDGRTKELSERKVTKTYRLKPLAIRRLGELAKRYGCSETEAVERAILAAG